MILPTKHLSARQSLLGVGAVVLERLTRPKTVTALWEQLRSDEHVGTYRRFIFAIDLLFIMGLVEYSNGLLERIKS